MKFNNRILKSFKTIMSLVNQHSKITEETDFSTATPEEREYCRKLCLRLAKKLRKEAKVIGGPQ